MRKTSICLVLAVVFGTSSAFALDGSSRLGAEIKAISTPVGVGILFGWRYLFHTSPYFTVGGAGYTGQISSGTTASYSYGGMIGAFHLPFTPNTSAEITILGGGGGGRLGDGTFFGGTVVEPGVGFSFKLGRAVQFVVGGSYVWMPGSASGTGVSGGVKFEFISDHRIEPVVPAPANRTAPAAPVPSTQPIVQNRPGAPAPRVSQPVNPSSDD